MVVSCFESVEGGAGDLRLMAKQDWFVWICRHLDRNRCTAQEKRQEIQKEGEKIII